MDVDKLFDMIKRHEGLRLKPYKCSAGKTTIGYGRNLDDVGISEDEADLMRFNDLKRCMDDLNKFIPWWIHHHENIQMVLLDMCFNVGINGLLYFKRTLAYIRDQKYFEASQEMLKSKWADQVGDRAIELSKMVEEVKGAGN